MGTGPQGRKSCTCYCEVLPITYFYKSVGGGGSGRVEIMQISKAISVVKDDLQEPGGLPVVKLRLLLVSNKALRLL